MGERERERGRKRETEMKRGRGGRWEGKRAMGTDGWKASMLKGEGTGCWENLPPH